MTNTIQFDSLDVVILDNQDDARAISYFGQPDGVYESPEGEDAPDSSLSQTTGSTANTLADITDLDFIAIPPDFSIAQ